MSVCLSNWENSIIEEKFSAEQGQEYISPVEFIPNCTHDVFVVPKKMEEAE